MDCLFNIFKLLFLYSTWFKENYTRCILVSSIGCIQLSKANNKNQTYCIAFPFITSSRHLLLKTGYFACVYRWPWLKSICKNGPLCVCTLTYHLCSEFCAHMYARQGIWESGVANPHCEYRSDWYPLLKTRFFGFGILREYEIMIYESPVFWCPSLFLKLL